MLETEIAKIQRIMRFGPAPPWELCKGALDRATEYAKQKYTTRFKQDMFAAVEHQILHCGRFGGSIYDTIFSIVPDVELGAQHYSDSIPIDAVLENPPQYTHTLTKPRVQFGGDSKTHTGLDWKHHFVISAAAITGPDSELVRALTAPRKISNTDEVLLISDSDQEAFAFVRAQATGFDYVRIRQHELKDV